MQKHYMVHLSTCFSGVVISRVDMIHHPTKAAARVPRIKKRRRRVQDTAYVAVPAPTLGILGGIRQVGVHGKFISIFRASAPMRLDSVSVELPSCHCLPSQFLNTLYLLVSATTRLSQHGHHCFLCPVSNASNGVTHPNLLAIFFYRVYKGHMPWSFENKGPICPYLA